MYVCRSATMDQHASQILPISYFVSKLDLEFKMCPHHTRHEASQNISAEIHSIFTKQENRENVEKKELVEAIVWRNWSADVRADSHTWMQHHGPLEKNKEESRQYKFPSTGMNKLGCFVYILSISFRESCLAFCWSTAAVGGCLLLKRSMAAHSGTKVWSTLEEGGEEAYRTTQLSA